jgi:hypothetical protein
MSSAETWDDSFNVLVIGSRAARTTAAPRVSNLGIDEPKLSAYVKTWPTLVEYLKGESADVLATVTLPGNRLNRPSDNGIYRMLRPLPPYSCKLGKSRRNLRAPLASTRLGRASLTRPEMSTILRKDPRSLKPLPELSFRYFRDITSYTGFPSNPDICQIKLASYPDVRRSVTPDTKVDEVLLVGIRMGVSNDFMNEASCIPVCRLQTSQLSWGMSFGKGCPSGPIVNAEDQCSINDTADYSAPGRTMVKSTSLSTAYRPSHFILGGSYHQKCMARPHKHCSSISHRIRKGRRALINPHRLSKLAENLRIEPVFLQETIEDFNDFSDYSKDQDFGRREEAYELPFLDTRTTSSSTMTPPICASFQLNISSQHDLSKIEFRW